MTGITFQPKKLSNKINLVSTDKTHKQCLTSSPESINGHSVQWIGKPIYERLITSSIASVKGTTSRGIFLELPGNWIAFLSNEKYHGPLTMNVDADQDAFSHLRSGDIGFISNGIIDFRVKKLRIIYGKSPGISGRICRCPPVSTPWRSSWMP